MIIEHYERPLYERHFHADDWGGADAAYLAAVAHFERLRGEADLPTSLETQDVVCRDGVNRPMLTANMLPSGALVVLPTIVRDNANPDDTSREMWSVRAQHPRWSPSQLRVFPGGRQDFDELTERPRGGR